MTDTRHSAAYAPKWRFDRNEPFFPVRIGVSLLRDGEASPRQYQQSFHRFRPSTTFVDYDYPDPETLFVPWVRLYVIRGNFENRGRVGSDQADASKRNGAEGVRERG